MNPIDELTTEELLTNLHERLKAQEKEHFILIGCDADSNTGFLSVGGGVKFHMDVLFRVCEKIKAHPFHKTTLGMLLGRGIAKRTSEAVYELLK